MAKYDPIEMPPPVTLLPRGNRNPARDPGILQAVSWSASKKAWTCTCWRSPEVNWCKHLESYWSNRKDSKDLWSAFRSGTKHFSYRLAGGLVHIPITIERWSQKDLGMEGDEYELRMVFSPDIAVWMDDNTAGIDILGQIITMVTNSRFHETWDERVFKHCRMNRGELCSNRFHDHRNSNHITDMINSLAGADEERKAFVFANAYFDMFEGRCMSCKLRVNFDNDIPSL